VRIRYIGDILLLIITNFVVWSWALEKHPEPEIQHVSMHNIYIGIIFNSFKIFDNKIKKRITIDTIGIKKIILKEETEVSTLTNNILAD